MVQVGTVSIEVNLLSVIKILCLSWSLKDMKVEGFLQGSNSFILWKHFFAN